MGCHSDLLQRQELSRRATSFSIPSTYPGCSLRGDGRVRTLARKPEWVAHHRIISTRPPSCRKPTPTSTLTVEREGRPSISFNLSTPTSKLRVGLCLSHGLAPAHRRPVRPRRRNRPKPPKDWSNPNRLRGEAHDVQVRFPYFYLFRSLTRRFFASAYTNKVLTRIPLLKRTRKIDAVADFQQL